MRKKAKLPPAEAGGSFAVKVRTDKLEFGKQKAPLLKGAVSLKADWRIHPAQDESESHHRLRAVPLPLTREAKTGGTRGGRSRAPPLRFLTKQEGRFGVEPRGTKKAAGVKPAAL